MLCNVLHLSLYCLFFSAKYIYQNFVFKIYLIYSCTNWVIIYLAAGMTNC